MSRALVIVNPAAGGSAQAVVSEVVAGCRDHFGGVDVRVTGGPGDATAVAAEVAQAAAGGPAGPASDRAEDGAGAGVGDGGTVGLVLSVGGDGTASEVAQGLAGCPVPMFIVPAGTANSCYRTLWGERPWQQALGTALADQRACLRRLDLARLAELDRLVLAGACAGFPPQAIHEARLITGLAGPARYEKALAGLVPRFEPYPGRVVVDGEQVHCGPTLLANVGGSRYRGGNFEVLPRSVMDDGLLDVCVVGGEHPPAEVLSLTRTAAHLSRPGVVYARGRRVTIERTDGRPAWFEHDGEVLVDFGCSFTVEVVPAAVGVLTGLGAG